MFIVDIEEPPCPPSNTLLFQWWVNDVRPLAEYQDKIDLIGQASLEGYTLYYQKRESGSIEFEVPVLRFVYHSDESRWVVSSYDALGNWVKLSAAKSLEPLKVRNLNDSLPERSRHNSHQNESLTDLTSALQSKHGCLLNTFMLFSGF